jgi:hypothetical protein
LVCGASAGYGRASEVWKFSLSERIWSKAICTGDAPSPRDGLSGSYIGNGKFVIFGGQGFPEPNQKMTKGAAEYSRSKTFNKRDILNDLCEFDCVEQKWTPIYPDGLLFPMGRRGHSAIYIDSNLGQINNVVGNGDDQSIDGKSIKSNISISSSSASKTSSVSVKTNKTGRSKIQALSPITKDSLVIFGGAGIELSKYTEQIYNDMWVYSYSNNTWARIIAKGGIDPKPVFQHRMERCGDSLVVIGGIFGQLKSLVQVNQDLVNNTDVMIFNMITASWSFLKLWESSGSFARFNFHGFTTALDIQDKKNSILIFGGRDIVTKLDASLSRVTPIMTVSRSTGFGQRALTNTFLLDVDTQSIQSLNVPNMPSDRYLHFGTSAVDADLMSKYYVTKEQKQHNKAKRRRKKNDAPIPHKVEHLMYVFGGASTDSSGFCDPVLYELVRIRSTNDNPYVSSSSPNQSKVPSRMGSPNFASRPSSRGSVSSRSHPSSRGSVGSNQSRPDSDGGLRDQRDVQLMRIDETSGIHYDDDYGYMEEEDYTDRQFGQSETIWTNLQMRGANESGIRQTAVPNPSNWNELKLSLSAPLSRRSIGSEKQQLSTLNINPLDSISMLDAPKTKERAKTTKRTARSAPSFRQKGRPHTTSTTRLGGRRSGEALTGSLPDLGTTARSFNGEFHDKSRKDHVADLRAFLEPLTKSRTKIEVRSDFRRLYTR